MKRKGIDGCQNMESRRANGRWSNVTSCLNSDFLGGFPGSSAGKESSCSAGGLGSIPRSRRSPRKGNGYPLQYSGLENSMDRGAWRATVRGVAKSLTWLSDFHFLLFFPFSSPPTFVQRTHTHIHTPIFLFSQKSLVTLQSPGWNLPPSWKCVKVTQLCLTLATPWTVQSMEFSRPEYWSGSPFPSLGDLPNPGIEPRSPALQEDSLPAEPWGKSKNTGVGSLSLLQWIFPTQESNQGLLHCRWILYQLIFPQICQTILISPISESSISNCQRHSFD